MLVQKGGREETKGKTYYLNAGEKRARINNQVAPIRSLFEIIINFCKMNITFTDSWGTVNCIQIIGKYFQNLEDGEKLILCLNYY